MTIELTIFRTGGVRLRKSTFFPWLEAPEKDATIDIPVWSALLRAPEGLIVHSAGQGDQGYYVYDIWESREAFERFMEEKLGPALGEVMGGPPPEGGAPQYFPIDVLIVPH